MEREREAEGAEGEKERKLTTEAESFGPFSEPFICSFFRATTYFINEKSSYKKQHMWKLTNKPR
jgi:hypothetical protein